MKKLLLFAVLAVMAVSASAQFGGKQSGLSRSLARTNVNSLPVKKIDASKITAAPEEKAVAQRNVSCSRAMCLGNVSLANTRTMAPARLGQLQDSYQGSCLGYFDKANLSWTMYAGHAETGELLLADVCPNPWADQIGMITVEYSIDGNIITIAPQPVVSAGNWDGWFCSATSADGSVTLTLGDDGSLATEDYIGYFANTKNAEVLDFDKGLGWVDLYTKITYLMQGQEPPVVTEISPEYEPEGLYLHMGLSRSFYGYQNNLAMMPAFAPVSFKNCTDVEGASYNWSVTTVESAKTITASTKDFAFETEGGEIYSPVLLEAAAGEAAGAYAWGLQSGKYDKGYVYAGATADSYEMADGTMSIVTKCNPDFQVAYYGFIATPDKNTQNYSLRNLYLYQGRPTAPLYCEGVTYLVRDFEARDDFNLTCQIRRFSRSENGTGTLGDVLYESSTVNFVEGDQAGIGEIQFTDFYTYDEDGMTISADYMFIDDEICVAILGWDNGSFSCNPYGEYDYNETGLTSTFFNFTPDETQGYTGDELYRFPSLYSHQYIGFLGATYGWLRTAQSTDILLPAEGGSATLTVNPMLCSVDGETGSPVTRLFLDESSDIPEWLDIEIANEDYDETFTFDLMLTAEPLPAGESGREAVVTLWQEGAYLTLSVVQGENSVITATTINSPATSGRVYNLSGQQVNPETFNGMIIHNGRKQLLK